MPFNEDTNETDILILSQIFKHAEFDNNVDRRKLMRLIRRLERIADKVMEDRSVGGVKRFDERNRLIQKKYPAIDKRTLLTITQGEKNQIADENRVEIDSYIAP